jgi:hypothetical protein
MSELLGNSDSTLKFHSSEKGHQNFLVQNLVSWQSVSLCESFLVCAFVCVCVRELFLCCVCVPLQSDNLCCESEGVCVYLLWKGPWRVCTLVRVCPLSFLSICSLEWKTRYCLRLFFSTIFSSWQRENLLFCSLLALVCVWVCWESVIRNRGLSRLVHFSITWNWLSLFT